MALALEIEAISESYLSDYSFRRAGIRLTLPCTDEENNIHRSNQYIYADSCCSDLLLGDTELRALLMSA